MQLSLFLARVIGIWMIIVGIAYLKSPKESKNMFLEFMDNRPLLFLSALFTLAVGSLIVVSHNFWEWNWRLLITLFGWACLLKGAFLVLWPQKIKEISWLYLGKINLFFPGAVYIAIGLVLLWFGFNPLN